MGEKRTRGLRARVGCECCISRRGPRLISVGIQAGGIRGGRHSAGRCGISKKSRNAEGREALGVRAA